MTNKNKYFKVKRIEAIGGLVEYKVFGYDSKLEFLLGIGYAYDKCNPGIVDAIDQIKTIYKYSTKKIETVYRTTYKKLNQTNPHHPNNSP